MCVCVCVCVHVFVCMYVTIVCKNISIISISSSLQNEKNDMCVYDCVRACVCVWDCVANGCTYMFDSLGSEEVKTIHFGWPISIWLCQCEVSKNKVYTYVYTIYSGHAIYLK